VVTTKTAGAAVATGAGASSVGATLVKLAVVGAVLGGLSGGGYVAMHGRSAERAPQAASVELRAAQPAPAPARAASPAPVAAPDEPVARPEPTAPPPAASETPRPGLGSQAVASTATVVPSRSPERLPAAGREAVFAAPAEQVTPPPEPQAVAPAPPTPVDALEGELALVRAAHDALREGRPAVALERMDEHRKAYPNGALSEERDALRVGALCALGRADAQAEARAFLAAHPGSPFVARVREACLR
jgi:hypothetical protein